MTEELTAFHEAGHAYAAIYVGARVQSVTIDPDNDDGPNRFGDTVVLWSRRRFSQKDMAEKAAWVALAGPVAEMVYTQKPFHPATVAEWSQDWETAFESLEHVRNVQHRLAELERYTIELYQAFQDDNHWAAIGAIADSLLAHETLDEEMLQEIVEPWIGEV
jgi:ATP-dependent Zn protease